MNSGAFHPRRVVFVFEEDDAMEAWPFREPGPTGHRAFDFWNEFDNVCVRLNHGFRDLAESVRFNAS